MNQSFLPKSEEEERLTDEVSRLQFYRQKIERKLRDASQILFQLVSLEEDDKETLTRLQTQARELLGS